MNQKENNEMIEEPRKIFILAIIGAGFRDSEQAINMERHGCAEFIGNQHNPDWRWKKEVLKKLSYEDLETLYLNISENKEI